MKTFIFLFVLLTGNVVISQTVDEIINKHIEVMGGETKADIKSYRMTGEMNMGMGHIKAPMEVIIVPPDKMRVELEIMGRKVIQVLNGDEGWSVNPFMGQAEPEKLKPAELQEMKDQTVLEGQMLNYKDKGYTAVLLPEEEIDGRPVYAVKLTGKDSVINYIDRENYMIVKKTMWRNIQGKTYLIDTYLKDFKEFDGTKFSTNTRTESEMPMLNRTITVEKIELNKTYPDELFNKPIIKEE